MSRNELVMIVITMTNVVITKDALCQREYFLKKLYSEQLSGPQNRNRCRQHPQEHKQLNSWSTYELPTESTLGPPVTVAPSLHSCQAESFHSSWEEEGGQRLKVMGLQCAHHVTMSVFKKRDFYPCFVLPGGQMRWHPVPAVLQGNHDGHSHCADGT